MEQEKEYKFKTLSFDDMADYIEKHAPQDKKWFIEKSKAMMTVTEKDGTVKKVEKYNHLQAKRVFCEKYMPDILPVKKENKTPKVADRFSKWISEMENEQ
jgi:hypothetical protein